MTYVSREELERIIKELAEGTERVLNHVKQNLHTKIKNLEWRIEALERESSEREILERVGRKMKSQKERKRLEEKLKKSEENTEI